MTKVEVFAPAKINLTLHVTGRRSDGYHELDSLVTFAPVGDSIEVSWADGLSLTVEGPEAGGVPGGMDNLVLRAAKAARGDRGASFTLAKHLPVASGIGGGSSDAAAAVRGYLALQAEDQATPLALSPQILIDTRFRRLFAMGADIPMCLWPAPLRARGIGEEIEFKVLPPLPAILVNPLVSVPTGPVFAALERADNPPMPQILPAFEDTAALIRWLATQRNDLEAPARAIAPEIENVLSALESTKDCGLARMSGSGATCFGLYETAEAAQSASYTLAAAHQDWWIRDGVLGDMSARALPQIR